MGDEGCREEVGECINKEVAFNLKIVGILIILVACVLGVCMPAFGRRFRLLRPDGDAFFVVKTFAAGVILATAFIHMLPDAFEALNNPCLLNSPQGAAWTNFPFVGFITMTSALLTLLIEFFGSSIAYSRHRHNQHIADPCAFPPALPTSHDEERNNVTTSTDNKTLHNTDYIASLSLRIRHQIVSQVLEIGIVAHSVIIGIALGVSNSPCTIRPLVPALVFHQLFEGIALGGCISQAGFKKISAIMMGFFFSITTPLGITIGMAISSTYNENSPRALMVEGVFDSISSGILMYMSLVDLIATDFLSERLRNSKPLQFFAFSALFLGTGAMSLIAKWA